MALSDLDVKTVYSGDDSTTDFAIGAAIIEDDSSEIKVYIRDESVSPATETLQTEGSDYTLTGRPDVNSQHTTVSFTAAPASTDKVVIIRVLDLTQELDATANGEFKLVEHETAYDRFVAMIQQLNEKIQRAVKFPVTSSQSDVELPEPDTGKALLWASGGNLENSTDNFNSIVTEAEAAQTAAEAAQTAAETAQTGAETAENNAQDWATKTDGIVESIDYSSKAWAIGGTGVTDTASRGAAKEWAIETASTVDGTNYAAKEWALGTQTRGIAGGGSAKDWANYVDGVNTVDDAEFSAKYWAQQAAGSVQFTKVSLDHTNFQTAGTTNTATAFTLLQNDLLTEIIIKPTTQFAGTGITDYVLNIGISTDSDKFIFQFDLTNAVANDNYIVANVNYPAFGGNVTIQAEAISTGANLDQSTAGAFDLYWFKLDLE